MIGDLLSTTSDLSSGKNPLDKARKNLNTAGTALKVQGKSREQLIEMYNPAHECITPEVTQQVKDSGADQVLKDVVLKVAFDKCPIPTAPNAISPKKMDDILEYRGK